MRSCIFGEREDIILLFIEFIRRHLIYRPLGVCVCVCVFFFFFCVQLRGLLMTLVSLMSL